jgi:hypothetical protein
MRWLSTTLVLTCAVASPLYAINVTSLPQNPVVSYLPYPGATPSKWQQSFNPAFIEASAGTKGVRGLLIRSQNCTFVPGKCIGCNGLHPFVGSVISFAAQAADGSFAEPYLVYAPQPGLVAEEQGTEDPRVAYDSTTGLYHMFYTVGLGRGRPHSHFCFPSLYPSCSPRAASAMALEEGSATRRRWTQLRHTRAPGRATASCGRERVPRCCCGPPRRTTCTRATRASASGLRRTSTTTRC